jgi:Ca2+-binding RTX toxin-like protein
MKHKHQIISLAVALSLIIGGLLAYSKFNLEQVLVKAQNTPTLTVSVEKFTQNHLPNITGNCVVGDNLLFTIKKGNTGVVSETKARTCTVSPYSLTPTIALPDGKYKVSVSTIVGCVINNTIEGTTGDDIITGTAGNDTIYGNAGNDTLNGGLGCDTIYAGNASNNAGGFTFMFGDAGNDTIYGSDGQCEQILVQFKNFNKLQELTSFLWPISVNAQQNLCTPLQSYIAAVNLLNGTNDILLGVGEFDKLIGSLDVGTDYFYLGNDQGTYYLGGGDSDYAEIRNFECATDFIILKGTPGDYLVTYSSNVASIYFLQTNGGQDLIGKVDGISSGLDPNASCFNYVVQD